LSTHNGASQLWRISVDVPLGLISLYGYLSVRHLFRNGNKSEGRWLQVAVTIYTILFLLTAMYNIAGKRWEELLGIKIFFPLNLNPLAFILIMSLRLRKNIIDRFRLEQTLRNQNDRWEKLMHNIQLLVVEVTRDGKIMYVNPFGTRLLGAEDLSKLMGKDFFNVFIKADDRYSMRTVFESVINLSKEPQDVKTTLVGLDGIEHNIIWTGVVVPDESGEVNSLLAIGVETTQLDIAFREVENLKNELAKENIYLKEVLTDDLQSEIIGNSEALAYAMQKARQVAGTHAAVLLEGETGAGKELFANLIHQLSSRNAKPMIKVNCAALPDELIESELFGHEKGSFTGALQARKGRFELANGGTIFLDEISEMPLALQPKLLRVLQSGEFERIGGQQTIKVDVRVISATNRDLMNEMKRGRFREDLYYRLNVYPITIPSLRNRKTDIPLLVDHFIRKYAIEFKKDIHNISRADLNRLMEYDWPGNIRELINLVERSVISSTGDTLRIAWEKNHNGGQEKPRSVSSIKDLEREHILKILHETHWKINGENGAAEKLGLNPNTLRSRMKKLNISREETKD
ncbi:MAG TPA: sigma 54-interacting transcriptional regulator, partial [Chitinophagaceae bacterium]|nr:sigma 54-interacting transcriptional regulator [Chitinophagaceae bacterium]